MFLLHSPEHGNLPTDSRQLYAALSRFKKKLKKLPKLQLDLLFPRGGETNSSDFDVTLLGQVLSRCMKIVERGLKLTQGRLAPYNYSIGADIVRILRSRNILAHSTKISYSTYKEIWDQIKGALIRTGYSNEKIKMLAETSSDQVKLLQLEKQISENKNDIATLKEDKVDG